MKQKITTQTPGADMAQLIDPVPSNNASDLICCCYINATSKIQVARITNIPNWYFERVVFPGQRLVFEALPAGQLEIHTGMIASSILSDTIPCTQIQITDDDAIESSYRPREEQYREVKNESPSPKHIQADPRFEVFSSGPFQFQVAKVS
jgi:hypothetical protein